MTITAKAQTTTMIRAIVPQGSLKAIYWLFLPYHGNTRNRICPPMGIEPRTTRVSGREPCLFLSQDDDSRASPAEPGSTMISKRQALVTTAWSIRDLRLTTRNLQWDTKALGQHRKFVFLGQDNPAMMDMTRDTSSMLHCARRNFDVSQRVLVAVNCSGLLPKAPGHRGQSTNSQSHTRMRKGSMNHDCFNRTEMANFVASLDNSHFVITWLVNRHLCNGCKGVAPRRLAVISRWHHSWRLIPTVLSSNI